MVLVDNQPRLTDLHHLIDIVPSFPIYADELVEIARREHFPQEVIDFYSAFPQDEIFHDRDDLRARTDQLEIMHHQEVPQEQLVPEED